MDRKFTISNIKGDGEEPATSKAAAESCVGLEATVKQEEQEQQDPEQVPENENSDHEMDRKFTISNIKGDGEEPATSKAAAERCAGLEATVKQEEEEQQDPEQVPENEESDHDIEEMDFPFPKLQCEIFWDMIEDFPGFLRPKKLKANTSAENIIEPRPTWGPYYSSPLGFCTSYTSVASSSASASTVDSKSVAEQLRKEPQEPENSAESKNGVLQELLKWYKSDEYIMESRRLASGPNLSTLLGFTTPSTSVGSSSASASAVGSKNVADRKSDVKSEVSPKKIKANTSAGNIIEHRPALGPDLSSLIGFTTSSTSVVSSSASASTVDSKSVADPKSDVKSEVPPKN